MSEIHPSAFVDPAAEVGKDVVVGPFCYVGPDVTLGDHCRLMPHVTLLGPSTFGSRNTFYPHCTLGADPQDLKYRGGPTQLIVGNDNVFRENVTIHRGTEVDRASGGVTRIGNSNLLMVGVHVAHDCEIQDNIVIANGVQIAGHVRIESRVTIGGNSAMHHFVTVGMYAFVGGMSRITHDVPPYLKIEGYDQDVRAVNTTGMARWQISPESISAMKGAFRMLFSRRNGGGRSPLRMAETLHELRQNGLVEDEHVRYLCDFLHRKLEIGVYGRVREGRRMDTPEDRANFYQRGYVEPAR